MVKAAILVFALTSVAHADPIYVPKVVPPCVKRTISGEIVCCYSLDGVKAVYHADNELVASRAELKKRKEQVDALLTIQQKKDHQLVLLATEKKALSVRMGELTKKLIETDKALQNEKAKPKWGTWVSWGIAAAVTSAFAGYVLATRL